MCQLAVESDERVSVDPWEGYSREYVRTALVLDHFDQEINVVRGGISTKDGQRKKCAIALIAGADLIGTMSTPGLWSDEDLGYILSHPCFIIERSGTDMQEALKKLQKWRDNIYIIPQLIKNDISSTKIRAFLRQDLSVRWLIPNEVIKYIDDHGLYDEDGIRPSSRGASQEGSPKSTT